MTIESKLMRTTGNIDLRTYDLPSHTEAGIGTQLRFNHSDCPSGADTKQRLYVKAVDTGWVCYCHHCGNHGFLRTTKYRVLTGGLDYPSDGIREYTPKSIPSMYRSGLIRKPADFPAAQLLWLYSYGFTDTDIVRNEIGVADDGSIVIVKDDLTFENVAYYVRRKYSDDFSKGPKAILYKEKAKRFVWYNAAPVTAASTSSVVLVEDPISAMKIRKTGANVISLMGTHLTDDHKLFLTHGLFDRIMIMLDPDIAGKKAALKIKKQLQSIAEEVTIFEDPLGFQPKEADSDYIRKALIGERFIV